MPAVSALRANGHDISGRNAHSLKVGIVSVSLMEVRAMLTFEKCQALLAGGRKKTERKIGNNTILHKVDENTVAVRLHSTDVVTIRRGDTYELSSGGWYTVTTKARINEYSPARLHQHKNVWYIGNVEYADGIKLDNEGKVISGGIVSSASKRKALLKSIDKYVKGFAAIVLKNGLAEPSGGDCWGCLMKTSEGKTVMGVDHILEHFKEGYYVPSLLVNAILARNNGNREGLAIVWSIIKREAEGGGTKYLKQVLRGYFRKLMPELLKA